MLRKGIRLLVLTALVFSISYQVGGSVDFVDLCVDPGHGGTDPGVPTHYENWLEDDINLMVALALKDTLDWYLFGPNVIYTRLTDSTVELVDRPDIANAADAASFISIHHNSGGSSTVQGTETFYCDNTLISSGCGDWSGDARNPFDTLAKKVYMRIRDAFGYNPRGVKEDAKFVLKCTKMPSTLTEASFVNAGFFDSEADRFYNNTGNHRQVEATATFLLCRHPG